MKSIVRGKLYILLLVSSGIIGINCVVTIIPDQNNIQENFQNVKLIDLPAPSYSGNISIEETLKERRSIRTYRNIPLNLTQISQLLWSAQGITDMGRGLRTAPSAGALYPLEVYLLAGNINELAAGIYRYIPEKHKLVLILSGDQREALYDVSLRQSSVKEAPAVLVFSAFFERTTRRYGERGIRYVYMEAGHAAQNVYLQAVSLGLGTVVIGAFDDQGVKKVMNLAEEEEPLYIIPLGVY